jgi:hypothetical protein
MLATLKKKFGNMKAILPQKPGAQNERDPNAPKETPNIQT